MLLVIDVGNTNLTLASVIDGALLGSRTATTRSMVTVDEMELQLGQLLALDGRTISDVRSVCLASVVPAVSEAIEGVADRRGVPLLVADAATVPIPIRMDRPAEVGADRLVNALAVQRLYGTPAIVVDFGTATTFDVVGHDGAYLGGAIAPGLELGLEALAARTAKLPRIELRPPERAIGSDTVTAMRSGATFGYIGLTKELLGRIRAELAALDGVEPSLVRTVATGGLAHHEWIATLPGIDATDPDLTLKGLAILHEESTWSSTGAGRPGATGRGATGAGATGRGAGQAPGGER